MPVLKVRLAPYAIQSGCANTYIIMLSHAPVHVEGRKDESSAALHVLARKDGPYCLTCAVGDLYCPP